MAVLVPAILPASRKELEEKLALLAPIELVKRVQIDIVDGKFAAPASWPYTAPTELVALAKRGGTLPYAGRFEYEMDLMCLDAPKAVGAWLSLGASRLTFHAEGITDLTRLFVSIKQQYGGGADFAIQHLVSFGLAVNIGSDLALIEPHLKEVGYVQFMGIATIGRQGQPFDKRVIERVRTFHARHPEVEIQVDGGVSLQNAKELIGAGAHDLVVGSAILKAKDPAAVIAQFEALETLYGM